jgi:hypothetical protein
VKAKLVQEPFDIENGLGQKVTMTLQLNDNKIELITTFSRGVGIIEQQQRNEGKVVSSMKLLNDRG